MTVTRADLEVELVRARIKRALFEVDVPPARVGRFIVLEKVGAGAMGRVFVAYDPQLDRKVALKLLRPDAPDEALGRGQEHLLREARAMANVMHPNVLAVYEAGVVGDEVFVAMEYAGGGTLRRWRAERVRRWQEILDACLEAARGLAAAHAAGVVHRDFKPDNVLLSSTGQVRVADFGLAGVGSVVSASPNAEVSASPLITLTHFGEVIGTPAYMAPEQHRREKVGPAADQFAFCVTAWELFYGERPFHGVTHREIADHVLAGAPPTPPVGTDVPSWIRDTLSRGLRLPAEDRYPTLEALIAKLERQRARSRRRVAVAASIAFAAVVGVGAALLSREVARAPACPDASVHLSDVWNPASRESLRASFAASGVPRAAETFQHTAQGLDAFGTAWIAGYSAACEATHVRHEQSEALLDLRMECLNRQRGELLALVRILDQARDPEVMLRAPGAVQKLPSPALCADTESLRTRAPLPADPETQKRIRLLRSEIERARALNATGQGGEAYPLARRILDDARALGWAPLRAEAVLLNVLINNSDPGDGSDLLYELATAGAEAGDDRVVADAWIRLIVQIGYTFARHQEALRLRRVAEVAVARAGHDDVLEAGLANALGIVIDETGDHATAQSYFLRSLALRERALGPEHPDVAASLNNLGDSLYLQGKLEEARAHHERSLALKEKTLGPMHPDISYSAQNLGVVALELGDYSAARAWLERAIACHPSTLRDPQAPPAGLISMLGDIARYQGELELALAHARRAVELASKLRLADDHPLHAEVHLGLGAALEVAGDTEGALAAFRHAVDTYEHLHGREHQKTAAARAELGARLLAEGQRSAASAAIEESVRVLSVVAGDAHAETIAAILTKAELHTDDVAAARQLYERALRGAESRLGRDHPLAGAAVAGLGELLARAGDRDGAIGAIGAYERAVEIFASRPGPSALRRGRARLGLARLLLRSDAARARSLAALAEVDFVAGGHPARSSLHAVRAFLAARHQPAVDED